jgi:hypothetical protein
LSAVEHSLAFGASVRLSIFKIISKYATHNKARSGADYTRFQAKGGLRPQHHTTTSQAEVIERLSKSEKCQKVS